MSLLQQELMMRCVYIWVSVVFLCVGCKESTQTPSTSSVKQPVAERLSVTPTDGDAPPNTASRQGATVCQPGECAPSSDPNPGEAISETGADEEVINDPVYTWFASFASVHVAADEEQTPYGLTMDASHVVAYEVDATQIKVHLRQLNIMRRQEFEIEYDGDTEQFLLRGHVKYSLPNNNSADGAIHINIRNVDREIDVDQGDCQIARNTRKTSDGLEERADYIEFSCRDHPAFSGSVKVLTQAQANAQQNTRSSM